MPKPRKSSTPTARVNNAPDPDGRRLSEPNSHRSTKPPVLPASDESLLDLPLREFVSTGAAAEILGIRHQSLVNQLTDPRIRKVRISEKCWLILRSSLEDYKATRRDGGRPRLRP